MKIALILSGLLLPSLSLAHSSHLQSASDDHIRLGRPAKADGSVLVEKPFALVAGTYPQSIDHAGKLPDQTFEQRYWVNSEYASAAPDAPVILHICGESDAEQGYFLNDNAVAWAQALGAHVVYLEHRYYGKSLPFADLSADHLQYLTLNNVIEDLASFQKWIADQKGWKGKWLAVGGSYSGTLSAIYRQKHPELVVGALASSAPMISGVGDAVGSSDDVANLASTDPSDDSGARQWVYQSCTTFGFWEANGPTIDAGLQNPSAWLCQQLFGKVSLVNSDDYNKTYDSPFLVAGAEAPSHILFTYGSDDVWTKIGLIQQSSTNSKIVIQVIQGAGHHYDLNLATSSDSSEVLNARAVFLALAKKWLD